MYFTFNGEDTPCRLRTKRYCIRTFLSLAAERQGAMRHLRFVNSPIIRLSLRKKQISGCLAAGVNAINAYIVDGRKPEDYVEYAKKDADGIVREDLLMTMSEGLNRVTHKMESLGRVILKDENGKYVTRGNRNIKINGENIKPILAEAVKAQKNVKVINHVHITDYIT